jgi:hypothetical protein
MDWSRVARVADASGVAVPVLQRLAAISHHEPIPDDTLARLTTIVGRAPVCTLAMEAAGSWHLGFADWCFEVAGPRG